MPLAPASIKPNYSHLRVKSWVAFCRGKKARTFRDEMRRRLPIFCLLWGGFEERSAVVGCFNLLLPQGQKKEATQLRSLNERQRAGICCRRSGLAVNSALGEKSWEVDGSACLRIFARGGSMK